MVLRSFRVTGVFSVALLGLALADQSASAQQGWVFQPNQGRPTPPVSSPRAVAPAYYAPTYAVNPPAAAPAPTGSAQIQVDVPASARVYFDGTPTTQTGPSRDYVTSGLTPGVPYRYTVRVEWQEGGRTVERSRTVSFMAGARVHLDFIPATVAAGK